MSHETLVGLHVVDEGVYARYREAMTPILERYGGGFRLDFIVARALRSDVPHEINRVFAIHFPDASRKEAFFADPAYRDVRAAYFDRAVKATAILATYER